MTLPETVLPQEADRAEDRDASIVVADVRFVADASGALWWPATRTLIVADLHLEKGSSYGCRGTFLPPYDSRSTLARLRSVVERRNPERVILLGDSFHDVKGMARLPEKDRGELAELQDGRTWIWVTGNHDPKVCDRLGGTVCPDVTEANIVFRHIPARSDERGHVAGHFHPVARVVRHGRSIRRRAFVFDERTLILPAFGAYTGGLNVRDDAFAEVFCSPQEAWSVLMVGQDGVYPVATKVLRGD